MTEDERKREKRRQAKFESLGTNEPACSCCGEDDYRTLELHHVAGKAYCDGIVILCRNCHRKLSDGQYDHPKKLNDPPGLEERVAHLLYGLADFFISLATSLRDFAKQLIEKVSLNAKGAEQ